MAGPFGFFFDAASCSGCKACQAACKDRNDLPAGVLWRRVFEVAGGSWRKEGGAWVPDLVAYNISLACNHCEEPACRDACPSNAIAKREDGAVLIDPDRCLGCRYCEWACPYGAPRYDPAARRMTKCDFCAEAIARGEAPSCVRACPMRALEFGPIEELRRRHGENSEIHPLPSSKITKPSLVVKPHRDAAEARRRAVFVRNREEV